MWHSPPPSRPLLCLGVLCLGVLCLAPTRIVCVSRALQAPLLVSPGWYEAQPCVAQLPHPPCHHRWLLLCCVVLPSPPVCRCCKSRSTRRVWWWRPSRTALWRRPRTPSWRLASTPASSRSARAPSSWRRSTRLGAYALPPNPFLVLLKLVAQCPGAALLEN